MGNLSSQVLIYWRVNHSVSVHSKQNLGSRLLLLEKQIKILAKLLGFAGK